MRARIKEQPSYSELSESLKPVPLFRYDQLTPTHWQKIRKAGTLSHSIHPNDLIDHLRHNRIISKSSDATFQHKFLFVHLTKPENNTYVMQESYPGPFCNSFGAALILNESIASKSLLPRISNAQLKYILEPAFHFLGNVSWQMDVQHLVVQKITTRLNSLKISFPHDPEKEGANRLLTVLTTAWNLRVYRKVLNEPTFQIDDAIGANISQLRAKKIMPLSIYKKDISFVVIK